MMAQQQMLSKSKSIVQAALILFLTGSEKIDWTMFGVELPKANIQRPSSTINFYTSDNNYKQEIYTQPRYKQIIGYTEYVCPTRK
jgi:hypothetical protein